MKIESGNWDADKVGVQYLVEEILSRDACITVNDGTYKNVISLSDSRDEVIEFLTCTGADYLIASKSDGVQLGWFCLNYGKGGIIVITYLRTAFCQEVYDRAGERLDSDVTSRYANGQQKNRWVQVQEPTVNVVKDADGEWRDV